MFFDENTNKDIFEDINNKLCNMRPFESGLLYLPHISSSGERAPFFEPNASAQIMGITVNTTKYDVIHSIMEGVALSIKDCLRTVDVMGKVYLTGGGAKSIIWAQIISNCINKDILISESKELSAKGAAISAELMIDKLNNMINIGRNFNRIKVSVRPNEDYVRKYEEIYSMYKKVQSDAKKFWDWRARRKIKGGVF
jgi:sugar (pentulose or hexulose) kinase